MNGTIHSTRGLRRLTRLGQPLSWRVFGFVLVVAVGALVIAWIDTKIYGRMQQLERDFAAIKTERFYQAVRTRIWVRHQNDALLRYHLQGDRRDLDQFRAESQELKQWIAARTLEVSTEEERALFRQLAYAYEVYLRDCLPLHNRNSINFTRALLNEINEKLRKHSEPFLDLCEKLMQVQSGAFGSFLQESQRTLDSFQRLTRLSLILLIALSVSLVVLVYRGMITPLRLQLSESQAIIQRQEKLAALGGLAAGVAHEIRNPLTAIKFRLFSLRKSLGALESENEDANVIADEINRLERIVKDFLQFARPSEPELVDLPVARLLEEVRDLLRSQLEKTAIRLVLEAPDGLWVRADAQQLKQVMINLIQNAADSIGRDGTITLRGLKARDSLGGATMPVAVIEIADTGKGIPPEVRKRLFDPFFTTKEGGTGLGLPIAARIVEKHGGELRYETQANRGTTFKVLLPRVGKNES
jgi:signal transduction histidine kinase